MFKSETLSRALSYLFQSILSNIINDLQYETMSDSRWGDAGKRLLLFLYLQESWYQDSVVANSFKMQSMSSFTSPSQTTRAEGNQIKCKVMFQRSPKTQGQRPVQARRHQAPWRCTFMHRLEIKNGTKTVYEVGFKTGSCSFFKVNHHKRCWRVHCWLASRGQTEHFHFIYLGDEFMRLTSQKLPEMEINNTFSVCFCFFCFFIARRPWNAPSRKIGACCRH